MPDDASLESPDGPVSAPPDEHREDHTLEEATEAILFAADEPVAASRISTIVADVTGRPRPSEEDVTAAVERLNAAYEEHGRAFEIKSWAGGFRMVTRSFLAPFAKTFYVEDQETSLSRSLMETLAVIAYRQPVTRPEVDFVRGVNSDYAIRKLLEMDLASVEGRADSVGRPLLYGTTNRFLEQFGLGSLDDLPTLREVEDLLDDPAFDDERAQLLQLDREEGISVDMLGTEDADSSDRDGMRINKYIAHAGVCSRRDADDLVEQGRVKLDGETVTQHGTRVQEGQTVTVDGEEVYPLEFEYLLLNKPKDTISTTDDPKGRQTILDVIGVPEENPSGLFPVGRLDRNTTGVLLATNDGDLAHRLMHPRYEIPKIYYVRLQDRVKPHQLDALARGVELSDGEAAADQVAYLDPQTKTDIALELHEGRNRQIRRMMETLEHNIVQLERAKYATLTTGPLQRGEWRRLDPEEVRELYQRVDLH